MKFPDLDPLGKRTFNIGEDLPLNIKEYFPFALAGLALVVLVTLYGFKSRWFASVGLILNLAGSILLFHYNDVFVRSYAGPGNPPPGLEYTEGFRRSSLSKNADRENKYALKYLILGFMLQFIGLLIDP